MICMGALLLFPALVWSQARDSVFLQNGQVLIGELKNISLGLLTLDETDLKIIKIKVYKIKYVVAESDNFRIETIDKQTYYSQLHRGSSPGSTRIFEGERSKELSLLNISGLISLHKGFFNSLDGSLGIGFSYTKSSKIGQLTTNSTIYYSAKKFENQFTLSSIASIDSSVYSRDNESVQVFSNYNFTESWFLAAQVNYQRNLELSIARRFQELVGAGNKFIVRNDMQLLGITGINLAQERSTEGAESFLVELPLMLRFNFFKYQRYNIKLSAYQTAYIGITDAGRFRYDGNLTYSQELIHNFYINLTFYSSFDSRPPDNNSGKTDFGTSLSISYQF